MRATRRAVLQFLGGAAAAAIGPSWPAACAGTAGRPDAIHLPVLGKVTPRPPSRIVASPLSVGFETLDRKMFDPERTYGPLAELGAKWARVQTGWARTEASPGKYDFVWLDAVVDRLRAIGIEPWFNLGYGNRLYTPAAPDASAVGWVPLASEEALRGWRAYVATIAAHFRGRVRHWEVWNEPNIKNFWKPSQPSPADYLKLVRATAPLIREAIPGAVLVGGALAGMPTDFLKGCLELGLGTLVEKITYHPYRPVPESNYEKEVARWRGLLREHRPSPALWQGENGCPSQDGSAGALGNYHWTEVRQAKWLLRRIMSDLRLGIELTSYFHTVDLVNYNWGSGPSGKTNCKGLLRGADYTPKPAYYAYQCLCALFDSESRRTEQEIKFQIAADSGPVDPAELHRAAFVRRERPLYVYWHPAGANQERELRAINVRVPAGPGDGLVSPVLVDPLSGAVHRLDRCEKSGAHWQLASVPLADYPLIITDASVVLPSKADGAQGAGAGGWRLAFTVWGPGRRGSLAALEETEPRQAMKEDGQ